jgi:hypothetical protein
MSFGIFVHNCDKQAPYAGTYTHESASFTNQHSYYS